MNKELLNKKQRYALDTMLGGFNVFLTGDAGTGKTTVIQTFIDEAEKQGKNVLVTATTGIAADNIGYGAMTVHRALDISIEFERYNRKVKNRVELLKEADILIIDEISMCRFDLFNMIAKTILLENSERTKERFMCESEKGDLQLIVIGDFYQLPPVITSNDRDILGRMYGTEFLRGGKNEYGYAFVSNYWQDMQFEYINLDEVCRQSDEDFKYVLNDIKYGNNVRKSIAYLENKQNPKVIPEAPFLVGTNAKADQINNNCMSKLNPDTEVTFRAITEGLDPADIRNVHFAKENLTLNIGAKVMITVNDLGGKYVNGTMGVIKNFHTEKERDNEYLEIMTDKGKRIRIYRYAKDIEKQVIEEEKDVNGNMKEKIVRKKAGFFCQFPVKLAWAISIHKSQGQTFEKLNIDPCCWDPGQFYVAVSRAKTADGIHFLSPIKQSYIKPFSKESRKRLEESFMGVD
ncbi:MAG: ATP-dependent RecD-like DNA helicase [Blautia sp.]